MNSVVVLGATSMLGCEIVRQLSAAGIEVIRAGRHESNDIVVNLGSDLMPDFGTAVRAEVMIHCASAFGDETPDGISENLRVNLGGCIQTFEIIRRSGISRLLYAGSISSYPTIESGSISSYGFSKSEAERILKWGMTKYGGDFCSLRLTQMSDTEGICCSHQPWFGRIVAYASRGLPLKMPISQSPRNFMHVYDAAKLMIRAAEAHLEGIHAVTYPIDIDFYEFAKAACRVFGKNGSVIIDPIKTPFRKVNYPRNDELFRQLGYKPQISPEQSLELIREAGTSDRFGPMDVQ